VVKITINCIKGSLKLSTSIGINAIYLEINTHQNRSF
jgi:hypothetical protein